MSGTIMQFGTSRFLQAHADLMLSEAREGGQAVGTIAVVETTGSAASRDRIAQFANAQPFRIRIRGRENGAIVDEERWVTGVEAGYSARDESGAVRDAFLGVQYVLSNTGDTGYQVPGQPNPTLSGWKSFPELLTALLHERYISGAEPPVIMPCELVSRNGDTLRKLVAGMAHGIDEGFASWIEAKCVFVNALVDRIVSEPLSPVGAVAEPYALWAMEKTPGFTPPCSHPQIELVDDLDAIERRKLFILNLGHTLLAQRWLDNGSLTGATVREAMADSSTRGWLDAIMETEVIPAFGHQSSDAWAYWQTCIERFSNPFLDHLLADIATNHVAKVERRAGGLLVWAHGNHRSAGEFPLLQAALPGLRN